MVKNVQKNFRKIKKKCSKLLQTTVLKVIFEKCIFFSVGTIILHMKNFYTNFFIRPDIVQFYRYNIRLIDINSKKLLPLYTGSYPTLAQSLWVRCIYLSLFILSLLYYKKSRH